jgi:hypothetical protein
MNRGPVIMQQAYVGLGEHSWHKVKGYSSQNPFVHLLCRDPWRHHHWGTLVVFASYISEVKTYTLDHPQPKFPKF